MKTDNIDQDNSANSDSDTIKMSILGWSQLTQKGILVPITIYLKGASMEPLIRCMKDPVRIVPVNRKLLEGDVVLFECADGKHVLHRVYRIKDE